MLAEIELKTNQDEQAEISLRVPAKKVLQVAEAIQSVLELAGHKVKRVNNEGEELFSIEEAFPEFCPANRLQGLRMKEEITQAELAQRLGISQGRVSDMESGKRPISLAMAKKIGEEFGIAYKVFL